MTDQEYNTLTEWDARVTYQLEILGDMDTSDAQSLLDAHDDLLTECWANNLTSGAAAEFILQKTKIQ